MTDPSRAMNPLLACALAPLWTGMLTLLPLTGCRGGEPDTGGSQRPGAVAPVQAGAPDVGASNRDADGLDRGSEDADAPSVDGARALEAAHGGPEGPVTPRGRGLAIDPRADGRERGAEAGVTDPTGGVTERDTPAGEAEADIPPIDEADAVPATDVQGDQGTPPGGAEPRLGERQVSGGAAVGMTTEEVLQQADPRAVAAWNRMQASGRVAPADADASPLPPPHAFHLRANVITREGANTNQLEIDYRYLAPSYVRFLLPSNRQTGRGTAKGLSGYWLEDGGEVQRLDTRENKEDRRLINEMLALARNFLALTDPERIKLTRLELLEGPPVALPREVRLEITREIRRVVDAGQDPEPSVTWIRVSSPDFDLVRRGEEARDARADQLVSLAIGPEGLPLAAVVRDPSTLGQPLTADASLISLRSWFLKGDFRVPYGIRIYRPEPDAPGDRGTTWSFGESPVQDIALSHVDLRPGFVPTDFDPR